MQRPLVALRHIGCDLMCLQSSDDTMIIAICTFRNVTEVEGYIRRRLDDAGYVNLVGLKGGFYAWCAAFRHHDKHSVHCCRVVSA